MYQLPKRGCCGLAVDLWGIISVLFIILIITPSLYSFELSDSAVSAGMSDAYSVVGSENGLLQVNPATIAATHPLYSLNVFYGRNNDSFNTSYGEFSVLDSTGSLAGGAYYGRIFNSGSGDKKIKLDNFYFALSEHYSESLYFGLGGRWIKDYQKGTRNWELVAGMMAKLGDYFRLGIAGYNLLSYKSQYFPKNLEFSTGVVIDDFFRGEIDYLQNLDNGWGKKNATLRAGIQFLIQEILGIVAGWQWNGFSHNAFSGGIFWRYPKGIVAYSFSSSQLEGEKHSLNVEVFIFQ